MDQSIYTTGLVGWISSFLFIKKGCWDGIVHFIKKGWWDGSVH